LADGNKGEQFAYNINLMHTEFQKEAQYNKGVNFTDVLNLNPESTNITQLEAVELVLNELDNHYVRLYNSVNKEKEARITAMTATPQLREEYMKLQDNCYNESLEDFVTSKNDLKKIVEYHGELVQKQNLIFLAPIDKSFFGAHFYAPSKTFFGRQITTLSANIMIIWGMTILLVIILFLDGFKRGLDFLSGGFIKESQHLIARMKAIGKKKEENA
jgi:hypothetical protein